MGAHAKSRRDRDWSLSGGTASNTALAALGLAAGAAVGDVVGLDAWWGAAGAVAGAVTSVAAGARAHLGPAALLHRLGTWMGAGSWLTWCLATTPWSVDALAALIVGAGVAGGLSRAVGRRPASAPALASGGGLVLRSQARLGLEWEARLARVCRMPGARVEQIRPWPSKAGYSLTVLLPQGGASRRTLVPYADALAADARLDEGCGVEIDRGPHRGSVVLHVATVNRMHAEIPYPVHDYAPKSILQPVVLGEHRDSSPARAHWREHSVLAVGQKGSGKTTLLNVATAEAGRCVDALVWHVDLTGGGLSRPWLHPWLQGRTDRPALDWAVCTPEDALEMVQAALRISKSRKASAFEKKMQANASLLPISAELPEIILIVDEGKTLLAPTTKGVLGQIRKGLEELQDIARDSAVNPVMSTLRATADTLSSAVKTQAVCRIAMAGSDDAEIAYLMGWRNLSVEELAGPGTGFLTDGATPRPFRCYNLLPQQIAELAVQVAARQPRLDEASAQAAGAAYANRYTRMRAAFTGQATPDEDAPASVRHLHPVPNVEEAWLTPAERAHRTTARPARADDADAWLTPSERAARTTPPPAGDDLLARAIAALDAAGDDRMHSEDLATALGLSVEELAAALREHGVRPLPEAFKRGGQRRRGYARTDLHAATQRHSNVGA